MEERRDLTPLALLHKPGYQSSALSIPDSEAFRSRWHPYCQLPSFLHLQIWTELHHWCSWISSLQTTGCKYKQISYWFCFSTESRSLQLQDCKTQNQLRWRIQGNPKKTDWKRTRTLEGILAFDTTAIVNTV